MARNALFLIPLFAAFLCAQTPNTDGQQEVKTKVNLHRYKVNMHIKKKDKQIGYYEEQLYLTPKRRWEFFSQAMILNEKGEIVRSELLQIIFSRSWRLVSFEKKIQEQGETLLLGKVRGNQLTLTSSTNKEKIKKKYDKSFIPKELLLLYFLTLPEKKRHLPGTRSEYR